MSEQYHRIEKESSDRIWSACQKKLDSFSSEQEKAAFRKRITEFIAKYPLAHSVGKNVNNYRPKRLTYENLSEFMDACDMSYKEVLAACSDIPDIEVRWGNQYESDMAEILDSLNERQQRASVSFIRSYVADDFLSVYDSDDNLLGRKTCAAMSLKCNESKGCIDMFRQLGIVSKWQRKKDSTSFTAVPIRYMADISLKTELSPHFILGLNEDSCVLAKSGIVETAMDLFCFLPESFQKILSQSFRTAFLSGGLN